MALNYIFIIFLCTSFIFSKEYVLLVSFDGFRHDYSSFVDTPNFDKIKKNGVKAKSLIPIFPTLTFPNHYSIVTGSYANKHKIIANKFYSKTLGKVYSMYDKKTVTDSSFYGSEPIWITCEQNDLKSASYFWVGSEAEGMTPSIYKQYDSSVSFTSRIDSVIKWYQYPESKIPNLTLLYFSEPDHSGHMFGPESMEVADAITQSDQLLGYLLKGLDSLKIKDKINLIVVSDHGMSTVTNEKLIYIEDFLPLDMIEFQGGGAIGMINEKKAKWSFKNILKKTKYSKKEILKHIDFIEFMDVYEKEKIPKKYNYINEDSPDFLLVAHNGWFITDDANSSKVGNTLNGMHGYDPRYTDTHGIFYAMGPAFNRNQEVDSFENIHIYAIICKILGIPEFKNIDGDINEVREIFR